MRIISGIHKSRLLNTLDGLDTRPMTDRMKESVFNIIGPYFDGEVVLDLFGGSGALSLESLSRGASKAYIVEKSYQAVKIIQSNIKALKEEERTRVLNCDYKVALNKFISEQMKFDIIFLDPPYKLNLCKEIIDTIIENDMLKEDGIICAQYVRGNFKPEDNDYYEVIRNYTHASSELCLMRKKDK